ncbi:MAG: outer membrane protein assembly factor BamC [Burkholderiaceae bacterium]
MINRVVARGAVLAALAVLAGCSSINELMEGEKIDYKSGVTKVSTLEVPPDLTQLPREDRFAVQQRGVVSASDLAARTGTPATTPGVAAAGTSTAAASSAVLPEFKNAKIERAGNIRWLAVSAPADKVYPIVREFWGDVGFALKVDSPGTGILETDWNENRANIPKDGIRRLLGTVLDGLYDSGTRDKFRTRLERRTDGGTDIYISHRGMQEVVIGNLRDQTRWDIRPTDTELENEFLRRLLVRFGLEETKAQAVVAQGAAPAAATGATAAASTTAPRARLVQEGGASVVQVDEAFDRAWRSVGLALDRLGYTVVDRDRTQGTYFVRTVDPNKENKEGNFFSRLFSSGKAVDADEYRISVKSQADKTQVAVLNKDGAAAAEPGNRILRLLVDELK